MQEKLKDQDVLLVSEKDSNKLNVVTGMNEDGTEHNITLAFTRMLAGPMDYTPGGFLNVSVENFKQQSPTLVANTRCAELSKFVIVVFGILITDSSALYDL